MIRGFTNAGRIEVDPDYSVSDSDYISAPMAEGYFIAPMLWQQADFNFGNMPPQPTIQHVQPRQATDRRYECMETNRCCSVSIPEESLHFDIPLRRDRLPAGSSSLGEVSNGTNQTGGVVQAMPLVGESTQEPLQLEDEGETIRPEHHFKAPRIGSSIDSYLSTWKIDPVLM
ncbi:hypothetical protein BDN72DRAFT_962227 [Pluteus cervinus]|uniref:Uncharacterized protein n=1 Tax=Pluteus cervinus TaxID=181527 RepID=A0ACD3AJT2_9AGAR|nr:hypothetical protein BDN72DRAFT_962227 [Pluteus cervinus]